MSRSWIVRLSALAAAVLALALVAVASGQPDTVRWSSSAGEVEFPHAAHVEEFGVECATCHHGTAALALAVPHPDYFDDFWVDCGICHTGREATDSAHSCATCHPPETTRTAVEMPSVKVAIHRSCWSCHEQGTGAEASGRCSLCHQRDRRPEAPATGVLRDK